MAHEPEREVVYKDPAENLDYSMDWGENWLAPGETITTSSWTASPGLTLGVTSDTDSTATAWVSGGTAGQPYLLTNTIVTSAGRTAVNSMIIKVEKK